MIGVLKFAALATAALMALFVARALWNRRGRSAPLKEVLDGEVGAAGWLLMLPLSLATLMGVLAAWFLLFVAFVCFFYALGLAMGEVMFLFGVLPLTPGNLLFHTTFPMQMFLMGWLILTLVVGGFQLVFGPLPTRAFRALRIDDVVTLVRRMAALLAIIAVLELARTVMVGSVLAPEGMLEFFARGTDTPLTDPTGLALLVAATALGALVVVLIKKGRD